MRQIALVQLLPSLATIGALCAGLTAVRMGMSGNYLLAVQLVLAAAVIDAVDGALARLLKADSPMGAQLDSLADIVNFGVAPAALIFIWAFGEFQSEGWIAVLIYVCCCAVRLARFNVEVGAGPKAPPQPHFVGVPAPAGALLAMLPMYLAFATDDALLLPAPLIAGYLVVIALLMISRIPTLSLKNARIYRANVKFVLVGAVFLGAALLTYAWTTLVAISLGYGASVLWAVVREIRRGRNRPARTDKGGKELDGH
jgi:CDP-diacylglycerol--serine O-phosphatidyltransferase